MRVAGFPRLRLFPSEALYTGGEGADSMDLYSLGLFLILIGLMLILVHGLYAIARSSGGRSPSSFAIVVAGPLPLFFSGRGRASILIAIIMILIMALAFLALFQAFRQAI